MSRQHLRIFVATGNGPSFDRLLSAVRDLAIEQPDYELFVQRGPGGSRYRDLPGADFISRADFDERLRWADVAVIHGGAGSLYEAVVAGHVPVVVPRLSARREIVNDHQLELAEALAALDRIRLCADSSQLPSAVAAAPRRQNWLAPELNELQHAVRSELVSTARMTGAASIRRVATTASRLAQRWRRHSTG